MTEACKLAKQAIEEGLQQGERMIVALEGAAATGKTTLAAELGEIFQAPVIHMDEFFLPPDMRTPRRFSQPGGNIHYERFEDQVAQPLRQGRDICYDVFDCSMGKISGQRRIGKGRLMLVEGVYSLHPCYRDIYTLRIFLKTASEIQDVRLKNRGEWLYDRFQSVWLPLEREYFSACQPERICDLVLET